MSENQTNTVSRQEETINIKDLIFLYLSKWKWFVAIRVYPLCHTADRGQ